ncbi:MAG: hypothetical protein ACXU82_20480 [Caulobacteraceae bacterium]
MVPFLFAAALALSPGALQSYQPIDGRVILAPPPGRPFGSFVQTPMVNLCSKLDTQTVAPDGVRMFKRLDQLPKGMLEHAVWRTVGGCPVREIVFEGRTYYVTSANPKLERLDPATNRIERRGAR